MLNTMILLHFKWHSVSVQITKTTYFPWDYPNLSSKIIELIIKWEILPICLACYLAATFNLFKIIWNFKIKPWNIFYFCLDEQEISTFIDFWKEFGMFVSLIYVKIIYFCFASKLHFTFFIDNQKFFN